MHKPKKQNEIVSTGEQKKTWSYLKLDPESKVQCRLEFILRTDIKGQMETYVELLERGLKDLKDDINKNFK